MHHFLLHVFGIDNPSGPEYSFWSGVGSDLSYLSVFAVLYRKHNCHVRGCWRIGHHSQGEYIVCHRHFKGGSDDLG